MTAAPVRYGEHPRIAPGSPCEACGASTPNPVTDHCHVHGWVRGIVCRVCNNRMSFIDRRIAPKVEALLLRTLVALRNGCPDCGDIDVSELAVLSDKRVMLTVRTETAMEFRLVRLDMSHPEPYMLTMDEVMQRLIANWRGQNVEGGKG